MSQAALSNPVLVEVTRGSLVESRHRGAIAVARADGELLLALGDVTRPIYPRSAVKLLQAVPLVESGAADAFGLDGSALAVACASHSGDRVHVEAVRSLLAKAGLDESRLACGAHWPISENATRELMRQGRRPAPIHNNCSGKHAGMLATAVHLGVDPKGYERPDHHVQTAIARVLSETCGVWLKPDAMGIDGCSVPTYPLPLAALAQGFARVASGEGLPAPRADAVQRLMQACFAAPVLVAGEGRFDTEVMRALSPACFVKGGAEGVHCAALPELGLGIALKMDDGAKRGTELALAATLAALLPEAAAALSGWIETDIETLRGARAGRIVASAELQWALSEFAARA
jgi:L-asparaginase II